MVHQTSFCLFSKNAYNRRNLTKNSLSDRISNVIFIGTNFKLTSHLIFDMTVHIIFFCCDGTRDTLFNVAIHMITHVSATLESDIIFDQCLLDEN